MHTKNMKPNGFTMVELSVVMLIIALLVGGIIVGRDMIRAAEIRSLIGEHEKFTLAVTQFVNKYESLPGDFSQAEQFWGSVTENGDGDGLIETPPTSDAGDFGEIFTFWQHLQLAGLINGSYTGLAGPDTAWGQASDVTIGENIPESSFDSGGWGVEDFDVTVSNPTDFAFPSAPPHYWEFGMKQEGGDHDADDPIMTPEEAYRIDVKMDDGRPATGIVHGKFWNDQCSTAITGTSDSLNHDARYRIEDDSLRCSLQFFNLPD
jgi:prepilin-type N-terminal cleavage/methylation domain-containing protein